MQASVKFTPDALHTLLDAVFDTEQPIVAPSYSKYGQPLAYLRTVTDVRAYLDQHTHAHTSSHELAVSYPSMHGTIVEQHIELDPRHCHGHTFRYRLTGWGMIQLHLDLRDTSAIECRISCNSEKRATTWEPQYPDLGPVSSWNWKAVGQHERRLIRVAKRIATL